MLTGTTGVLVLVILYWENTDFSFPVLCLDGYPAYGFADLLHLLAEHWQNRTPTWPGVKGLFGAWVLG